MSNRALEDRHWSQIFTVLNSTYDPATPFCVQDLIKSVDLHTHTHTNTDTDTHRGGHPKDANIVFSTATRPHDLGRCNCVFVFVSMCVCMPLRVCVCVCVCVRVSLCSMGVVEQLEKVSTIGAVASKERGMLLALDKMESEWSGLDFRVLPYKDTGT